MPFNYVLSISPKPTHGKSCALYRLTVPASNLQPRYNIALTMTIDAIIPTSDR